MSGADAGRDGIGGIFAYPMNDNAVTIKDCANTGAVVAGENCSTSAKAGQIVGYYYTDVAFDGVNKGTTDALMIGAYNNNDSGYNFATVDGTVATLVADSDMVAGGSYMVVAAGGKPVIELAKEESISFDTSLADIDATGITAVDGCRIEAIAEGLSITYTALVPGSEKLPWKIGPEGYEAEVVAWTNGMGTLVINGTGAVKSTPWDENSAGITRLQVAEDVTALDGTIETLPDLRFVNGLSLGAFNSAAVGAVKAAGFNAIAVENGKVTLTLVVKTAATVNAEEKDWTEAATKDVEVDASAPAGFFIVVPQTK